MPDTPCSTSGSRPGDILALRRFPGRLDWHRLHLGLASRRRTASGRCLRTCRTTQGCAVISRTCSPARDRGADSDRLEGPALPGRRGRGRCKCSSGGWTWRPSAATTVFNAAAGFFHGVVGQAEAVRVDPAFLDLALKARPSPARRITSPTASACTPCRRPSGRSMPAGPASADATWAVWGMGAGSSSGARAGRSLLPARW